MKLFGAKNKNWKKWHAKALLIDPRRTKIVFAESSAQHEHHVPPWIYRRFLGELPQQEIGEGADLPADPSMETASCFHKGGSIAMLDDRADGGK